MTTERSQKKPFRTILRRVPISKKLQFMVFVFVCIFFAVLGLSFCARALLRPRGRMCKGKGVGPKAQKQATIRLQAYAASRNEKDYQAFLDSLSVPLGDRVAREQLEKPEPDYAAIHAGFRQGKVANADIPGMITLFRRFRKTKEISLRPYSRRRIDHTTSTTS
jgi:hypothetical protein